MTNPAVSLSNAVENIVNDEATNLETLSQVSETVVEPPSTQEKSKQKKSTTLCRNLIGFWLLGLCNNYGYVVMLSAAHDILKKQSSGIHNINMTDLEPSSPIGKRSLIPHCNPIGTGAVLLANIFPAFIIKLTAPFFIQSIPYRVRVTLLVGLPAIGSFVFVAFTQAVWMSLLGVILASVSSGVGEITFLSMSAHYDTNVLSFWSSGTGGAGIFGAISYAGLIALGLTAKTTLLLMIIIPIVLMLSYYFVLDKSSTIDINVKDKSSEPLLESSSDKDKKHLLEKGRHIPLSDKIKLVKPLLKYMIPLGVVYFAEYFINQGLTELIEFEHIWLRLDEQYRLYAVIYQVGVFISRSSAQFVRIRHIWILGLLQFLNIGILLTQIYLKFIPVIWIMFVFILYEGLLGGAAYVNTFFMISEEVEDRYREYSLGVGSAADSLGIVLAGFLAVPVHNYLCNIYVTD